MVLGFADTRAEQAFQLEYGWPACAVGLITTAMGLLAHGMYVVRALLLPDQGCAFVPQIWHSAVSMGAGIFYLALYALLGRQRFVVGRGVHSVWQRLLFATGVLFYSRPGNCAAAGYCQLLWQHRLFLIHVVGSLARIPCGWFRFGGAVSWLVAVAVDVVDPGVACESVVCVLLSLQSQMTADPWRLLHYVICSSLRSSRVFAVDVVLPGLLLTWLELEGQARLVAAAAGQAAAAAAGAA
jgi:hypothetical protein